MMRRGSIIQGREHYFRDNVSYSVRTCDCLHDTPNLMIKGRRHLSTVGEYDLIDLNLPAGCVKIPVATPTHATTQMGWRSNKHSDFHVQPLFTIWPWYRTFVRERIGVIP